MLKFFTYFFIILLLYNCSSNSKNQIIQDEDNSRNPEEIYIDAMLFFENKNYTLAEQEFKILMQLYPLSSETIQAEVMSGFIFYLKMDYEMAILKFKSIIQRYPSLKNLDYVYYMIGISNYEQISNHQLDGKYNQLALSSFNQVILRFPDSEYAKDSRQKLILIKSNYAAKHLDVGRFYQKQKKYTAALNRFKIVVQDYSMTKFVPEALHRMVETYYQMGMIEESYKAASVLGYNYPDSKWYKYSYNLIKKEDNDTETILNKIKSFF